jgi:hypothetical protein
MFNNLDLFTVSHVDELGSQNPVVLCRNRMNLHEALAKCKFRKKMIMVYCRIDYSAVLKVGF